jgi:hypothetical protein
VNKTVNKFAKNVDGPTQMSRTRFLFPHRGPTLFHHQKSLLPVKNDESSSSTMRDEENKQSENNDDP